MISVSEALQKVVDNASPLAVQKIPAEDALFRHLTQDVVADRPIPPFDRVAMDGYAVSSADFESEKVRLRVVGKVGAGDYTELKLNKGEAIQIMTGSPLSPGADAVVKVENSKRDGDWVELVESKMKPGLNVAPQGEDAELGKKLIEARSSLTPAAIAVCSSVGLAEVEVFQKPSIKIICTGNEIVPPDTEPLPHQIRECNSYSLRSLVKSLHIEADFLGIAPDIPEELKSMVEKGLEADILLMTGGVSMGDYDYVPDILAELGVEKIFHKVDLKPGKPVWFGKTKKGTFVFGLPGNPVSVQVNFKLFVEPLIRKLSGDESPDPNYLFLPLAESIEKKNSREQFFPGRLTNQNGKTYVQRVMISGSGDFSNLAKSQGLIRCPKTTRLLEKDAIVEFLPWGGLC